MQQPVYFKPQEPLRLTDVNGAEWIVRFVDILGTHRSWNTSPQSPPTRQGDPSARRTGL